MMFLISFTIHSAAIGAKVTGVDETTFTRSGKAFSTVFMPRESSHNHRVLQKDNVEVAYDFASRYPVRVAFKLSNSHNLNSPFQRLQSAHAPATIRFENFECLEV